MLRTALALTLLLAGCAQRPAAGPIRVDAIGVAAPHPDPDRGSLSAPEAVLLAATAEGLVRFDANGQIMPGLAQRWDVSDDGLYYTFRLRDPAKPSAETVARRLRRAIRATANPMQPVLGAIDEVVAVTPEVIELRLKAPRPFLFQILAQPELGVMGREGGGPMRPERGLLIVPPTPDDADAPRPDPVRLTAARAALAVARFQEGRTDLVLGGGFADLPIARVARIPAGSLRFDPVDGLLGLAVVRPTGLLASADGRRALALAIDRERIVRAIGAPGQAVASAIVPGAPEGALAQRRSVARTIIAAVAGGTAAPLRIALPEGPGATLLFALLHQDFAGVGVAATRVGPEAPAELRLIDAVAPADEAVWQLRHFTCAASPVCSPAADDALAAARAAPTLPERVRHIARAAEALDAVTPFLAIATPVRWSLVAPSLDGFATNRRGAHPLDQLRGPRR